jgi:hypothetical protein
VLFIYKGKGIVTQTGNPISSDEISKVEILSFEEIRENIKKGIIKDGKTLIALYATYCTCF